MYGMFLRHYDSKEIENLINSGNPTLEQVLLTDNLDSFFRSENETVMK